MQDIKQPDEIETGTTRFDCRHCGGLIDQVFYDTDSVSLSWLACPSCGWDARPAEYELPEWYEIRYGAE